MKTILNDLTVGERFHFPGEKLLYTKGINLTKLKINSAECFVIDEHGGVKLENKFANVQPIIEKRTE